MRALVAASALWIGAAAPAAAQVGTWDFGGRAVARAVYEGHRLTIEYPTTSVVTLEEGGRYRVSPPIRRTRRSWSRPGACRRASARPAAIRRFAC
jgi:hypothetical protein